MLLFSDEIIFVLNFIYYNLQEPTFKKIIFKALLNSLLSGPQNVFANQILQTTQDYQSN